MNKKKAVKKTGPESRKKQDGPGRKTKKKKTAKKAPARRTQKKNNGSVLFAASEVYPFVKTGGLADVACFLPLALHEAGLDIRIVLPAYRCVLDRVREITAVTEIPVPDKGVQARLLQTTLPGSDLIVYLVDVPGLFDRPGDPYLGPGGVDWPDNAMRFALFGRVVRQLGLNRAGIGWSPAILHCNDWHTGLAPALLAQDRARPALVFTIHTLSYQGLFPRQTFISLGLPERLWSPEGIEFYGNMSFIKGGLVYSDRLVTVSPGYAKEIVTPEYGYGLEGLLQYRSSCLSGILNGVDYRVWDPRNDPLIGKHYWIHTLDDKRVNKRSLQQELGLHEDDDAILLAFIGRLVDQKGIDLVLSGLTELMSNKNIQLVVLGTGNSDYEHALLVAANRYEGRLAVHIGYNETLAHRITAGADILLMPSRFEPCGLTQLYSMRYGTIPVVCATGGLADTVISASDKNLHNRTATGFLFRNKECKDLLATVQHAVSVFVSSKERWQRLMITAMEQDFCWEKSAKRYSEVYADAVKIRKGLV